MRLKNKVALITGGGSGIGEATVLKFSEEGAKVVINDVNIENANKVAKKLKAKGSEVLVCIADISKKTNVDDMIKQIKEECFLEYLIHQNENKLSAKKLDVLYDWGLTNITLFEDPIFYQKQKKADMAFREAQILSLLSPKEIKYYNYIFEYLNRRADYQKMIGIMKRGLKSLPNDLNLRQYLVVAYLKTGKEDLALPDDAAQERHGNDEQENQDAESRHLHTREPVLCELEGMRFDRRGSLANRCAQAIP